MPFTLIPWEQPKMLLTDFQAKLRKIDTRLYVDATKPFIRENGLKFGPLYLKKAYRADVTVQNSDKNLVHAGHAKYLDALETGVMDTYITAICLDFIPEYDIFKLNEKYGDQITLVGNISPVMLAVGTTDEIKEYSKKLIRELAPGGGYIFSSGHSINPAITVDRWEAVMEIREKYGSYPIDVPA